MFLFVESCWWPYYAPGSGSYMCCHPSLPCLALNVYTEPQYVSCEACWSGSSGGELVSSFGVESRVDL